MARAPQADWKVEDLPTDKLLLDPQNPRLSDFGLDAGASQKSIISVLWSRMAVDELALSIAENGFYRHEPLYVAREGDKLHTIEGNRRLAAVKLLRDDTLRKDLRITSLPKLKAADKKKLDHLPAILCTRADVWAYLGFKHINGPQAWESYPKAHYIAWVHNDLDVPLAEIARRIGDKHSTVARLYDGLMVLQQAEDKDVFKREDRFREHFSFSHLTTGLGYSGVQKFLGLPGGTRAIGKRRPVPHDRERELGELLTWTYGSKSKSLPPVVQSQNPDLRKLDEVLRSKQGTAALREGFSLDVSLDISRGDDLVFRESLVTAKQSLQKARGTVLTGYDGNKDLQETAEDIFDLAKSLIEDMAPAARARTKIKRK